ncbi:MAG: tetratricopeptide repeat protein, partial [bacterium]|nr:tetratricopeptide repeat protein [bacterium]
DAALAWYQKSLQIEEQLGNRAGIASSYHQLGMVSELRGDYDAALAWYQKSLQIEEQLGNRAGIALSSGQLGLLFLAQEQPREAVRWAVRSLAILAELGAPELGLSLRLLGEARTALGETAFAEALAEHLDAKSVEAVLAMLEKAASAES